MKMPKAVCAFLLVIPLLAQQSSKDQRVRVLVLDALDGKPQAKVEINYFCTGKPNNLPQKSSITGADGMAEIIVPCTPDLQLELSAIPPEGKEQCSDLPPFSYDEIMTRGILTDPTAGGSIWCPTKVSKKLKAVPGQITIFVKKPTWWQSHVAG